MLRPKTVSNLADSPSIYTRSACFSWHAFRETSKKSMTNEVVILPHVSHKWVREVKGDCE